jgi:hypothetical protein
VDPLGNAWFNGTSWVDLMNPDMVKASSTAATPLRQRFAGQPNVRGIFPTNLRSPAGDHASHAGVVSFSPVVLAAFKARTGADLPPLLPSLFDAVGDWRRCGSTTTAPWPPASKPPSPNRSATTAPPITWSGTGHFNGEDAPAVNMLNEGALMQQYRHMQMPGSTPSACTTTPSTAARS